jgi:geranylgeranyl diphosphate synthase type II
MRYALFPGGKRLRPLLVLAAAECAGGSVEEALPGACAVELVHAYSLIHDDLPALDNDDLRRGRPTVHRAFDEALAILAGDALLTRAFEILASAGPAPERGLAAVRVLAEAAGTAGMIGGQVDDLEASGQAPDATRVESIHRRKTAALMGASARIGALLAGASADPVDELGRFGEQLGLAFQIVDDLLDREGVASEVGKAVRKDARAGKLTFPAVWGVEESRRRARQVADAAMAGLAGWGERARALQQIAGRVVERSR